MEDNNVIERLEKEIGKIDNKETNLFFFVIDTKGNPSGSLAYIYKLAKIAKKSGYNVSMIYQEDDFVGVESWLGEEYSSIPHFDISKEEVAIGASDILFIPEIFSNVMIQTKNLPCHRVAILQNFDFMLEQMPMAAQWGDLGIMDAICNTDINANLIKEVFPYVHTTTIDPFIDKFYGETKEPKKMIINIISKDQRDINRIIKPFYWKFPAYKWVSFRDIRGFDKDTEARLLRESAITIWVDEDTNFGYSALEAMKSGSLVIAKVPKTHQKWMFDENGEHLTNGCIWFDSFNDIHLLIANVVRSFICDTINDDIKDEAIKVSSSYTEEKTTEQMINYITDVLDKRKASMESLINQIKNKDKE